MSKTIALGCFVLFVASLTSPGQAADRTYARSVSPQAFPNLTTIYRASGVRDNGGAQNTGIATTIHCSNFNANSQQIRLLMRREDAVVVHNNTYSIPANRTVTVSTHNTAAFNLETVIFPGVIEQGSMVISATSAAIHCSASIIDAAAANPVGVELHLVRFNAAEGSQE